MHYFKLILVTLFISTVSFAQDDCADALVIPDVATNGCQSSSPSTAGTLWTLTCTGGTSNTTWFSFVAVGPTATINVSSTEDGWRPLFGLVQSTDNTCDGTLTHTCFTQNGNWTFIEREITGLTIGNTYWVAVQSNQNTYNSNGTITVCVDNPEYIAPDCTDTSGDCEDPFEITLASETQNCIESCLDMFPAGPMFADGPNCNDFPNSTAWFQITIPSGDATLNIELESADMQDIYYALFTNISCDGSETWTTGYCSQGTAGNVSDEIIISAGTTYYIAVSDRNGALGEFDMCLTTEPNNNLCNVGDELVETWSSDADTPIGGPYSAGEEVEFTYTINQYRKETCNWLSAIVPTFGDCWDPTSFTINGEPSNIVTEIARAGSTTGSWTWWEDGIVQYNDLAPSGSLPNGADVGAGWFFVCTGCGVDNNGPTPNDSYGDGSAGGLPENCDIEGNGYTWEVSFRLIAGEELNCSNGTTDCSVMMKTYADAEIGSYESPACAADSPTLLEAGFYCCIAPEINEIFNDEVCSGIEYSFIMSSNQDDDPGVVYSWTVEDPLPAGITGALNGDAEADNRFVQTITNETSDPIDVEYTIIADNGSCTSEQTFIITVQPTPEITGGDEVCLEGSIQLTGAGTPATQDAWLSSDTDIATVDNNGNVDGISEGDVTITYTDVNGCTNEINPFSVYVPILTIPALGATVVACPANATDPGTPGDITDNYGNIVSPVLIGSADNPDPIECNGERVWTYRYTACDGTTAADWTHTYAIDYSGALTVPALGTSTVACLANATDPGPPADITDACGRTVSPVLIGSVDDPDPIECNGERVWTYRYTACDGTTAADWTHTYTINTPTVVIPDGAENNVFCSDEAIQLEVNEIPAISDLRDNCDRPLEFIDIVEGPDPDACGGLKTFTYNFKDCADETYSWVYTYTITSELEAFSVEGTNPTECQVADGYITISGLLPDTDYEFSYNDGGISTITTTQDGDYVIDDLGPGGYNNFTLALSNCTGCENTNATTIALSDPNPPFINAPDDMTICEGEEVTLAILNSDDYDEDNDEISWNNGVVEGTPFIPLLTTTYTVSATKEGCTTSDNVTITVNPLPNSGEDGQLSICEGGIFTETDLYEALGGSPDVGGTWSPVIDGANTYIYTTTNSCGDQTANVVVETETADAGEDNSLTRCDNETDIITLIDQLGGTPETGGVWTRTEGTGGLFDANNGTFELEQGTSTSSVFQYTISRDGCDDISSQLTLNIDIEQDAGDDGELNICTDTLFDEADLFTALNGTPDTGGTWSPVIDGADIYTYTISSGVCPTKTATVEVSYHPEANPGNISGAANLCEGGIATYTSNGEEGGVWSVDNGTIGTIDLETGEFTASTVGSTVISYSIEDINQCSTKIATFNVSVSEGLDAGQDNSITRCDNEEAEINLIEQLSGTPVIGGVWIRTEGENGIFNEVLGTFEITPETTTSEFVYTLNAAGCPEATSTLTIEIDEAPNAGEDGTLLLCDGETLNEVQLFNALNGQPNTTGTWSPAIDGAGEYSYAVEGLGACINDTAIVEVMIYTFPNVDVTLNQPSCLEASLVDINTSDANVSISIDGQTANDNMFEGLEEGTYDVTLTNITNSCEEVLEGIVTIEPTPTPPMAPSVTGDSTYCFGDEVELLIATSEGEGELTWYDDEDLTIILGNSPELLPFSDETGTNVYYVTITEGDCESDYSIAFVTINECKVDIVISTAITPNGDGDNDSWIIPNLDENYPKNKVYIYNRWGNLLFESEQGKYNNRPWEGIYNNEELPVGSYLYIIKLEGSKDGGVLNGAITILR